MPRTTPLMLVNSAKVWEDFYLLAIQSPHSTQKLLPGMYCLFISLELRLKAYIVLLDDTYAGPRKLRSLGHDFRKIYEVIYLLAPSDMSAEVMNCLNAYNLFNNNINDLRYPETPRSLQIAQDLQTGNHSLISLFEIIDNRVRVGMAEWMGQ